MNQPADKGGLLAAAEAMAATGASATHIVELIRGAASSAERSIRAVVARVVAGGERRILMAPCVFCSYNGAGYWQSGTHAEDCPFHKAGGEETRVDYITRKP